MTHHHVGVIHSVIPERLLKETPIYRWLKNKPVKKQALHDIRLTFKAADIWNAFSNIYADKVNPANKDVQLPTMTFFDYLDVIVTIHHTDTVSVAIACSFRPIAMDILENLQNRYKDLSRKLVEARERGEIDPDSIVDESRTIIDIDDSFYRPEQLIDTHLKVLESLPENYKRRYIPRWIAQPHYVEVWVEKKTMTGVLKSILAGFEVRIVPTGGWTSFTYERNNLLRLKEKIKEGKKVHILYLGDYDPSGLRMDEKMIYRYLNEYGIDLKRIAIIREQIQGFDLQHITNADPEVLSKLRRDPNADVFRRNNDGRLFQIEVDVLQVLEPSILKGLLISNIERYFDKDIYNEVMKDPKLSSTNIRGLVNEKVMLRFGNS